MDQHNGSRYLTRPVVQKQPKWNAGSVISGCRLSQERTIAGPFIYTWPIGQSPFLISIINIHTHI